MSRFPPAKFVTIGTAGNACRDVQNPRIAAEQRQIQQVLGAFQEFENAMQQQDVRDWTVGETVRLKGGDRLMTVVRCHDDGLVSVAWFAGRKMNLEKVASDELEPVISEVIPPGVQRRS